MVATRNGDQWPKQEDTKYSLRVGHHFELVDFSSKLETPSLITSTIGPLVGTLVQPHSHEGCGMLHSHSGTIWMMMIILGEIFFIINLFKIGRLLQAVMCVGHLVMASAVTGSLYLGSIILGVCYGAQWSLMPAITSEIFGLRHFGTLFNTIGIASPVGAYILSVRVAGYLYDQEAQWQHRNPKFGDDDPLSCQGPSCFRLTFLILACVCAVGCAVCMWLFVRTKRFYQELHNRLHKNN